jgi:hypothetical protein
MKLSVSTDIHLIIFGDTKSFAGYYKLTVADTAFYNLFAAEGS